MARELAIGAQDFEKIVSNDCFYVDKTNFIKEWWKSHNDVTLLTRPRRFGKTLTMSMLDYFFSVRHAGRSDLFEGLSIWEDEDYRKLQGAYPVIFLSFASVKGSDYSTVRKKICMFLEDEYAKNEFLLDSGALTDRDKKFFEKVDADMDDSTASMTLFRLSDYLSRYYKKKTLILLDEYDTPMQEAYVCGYWNEMTEFMRSLFHSTFKTNPYMERGLLTGITRISKESVFSDLNNLEVISTTSKKYETSFGFTEEEVLKALKEYGLQGQMSQVREWYDGFRFGEHGSIYNPWSVTHFLDKGELDDYWANTSSNQLASELIRKGSKNMKMTMEDLLQGKTFHTVMDEEIVFHQLDDDESAVWSLLLASGYLKIVSSTRSDGEKECILALTNLETVHALRKKIRQWFSGKRTEYNGFVKALLSNSLEDMNEYINRIAGATFSYFDTGREPSEETEPERFYHGFVLGLLAELRNQYSMLSNRESGRGRYDVMLTPKDGMKDAMILEFKALNPESEKALQDTADAALKQIVNKEYAAGLETEGISGDRIRIYGFAFRGKEVLIDGGCILDYGWMKDV